MPENGSYAMGGVEGIGVNKTDYTETKESPFLGLEDGKTLISFAGGGEALQFSHTSAFSISLSQATDLAFSPEVALELSMNFEFTKPVVAEFETEHEMEGTFSFTMSSAEDHARMRSFSVTVSLSDGEAGDFFYLTMHTDGHFGTPIFNLVGGKTSCPGESGTLNTQGEQALPNGLSIRSIVPRCDRATNLHDDESCKDLELGEMAEFDVVFAVESVEVAYEDAGSGPEMMGFLLVSMGENGFDDANAACGEPGRIGGLVIMSGGVMLGTKAFTLDYITNDDMLTIQVDTVSSCLEYKDIVLAPVSACEWGMRGDIVIMKPLTADFQTLDANGAVDYGIVDSDTLIPHFEEITRDTPIGLDDNRAKTFSVNWVSTASTRRLGAKQFDVVLSERLEQEYQALEAQNKQFKEHVLMLNEHMVEQLNSQTLFILGTCAVLLVGSILLMQTAKQEALPTL